MESSNTEFGSNSGDSAGRCLPDPENSRPLCRCCLERASHQVSEDENKGQSNFINMCMLPTYFGLKSTTLYPILRYYSLTLYSTSFQVVLLPVPSIVSEPLCCLCSQVVTTSWICDGMATIASFSVGNVTEAHEHARHVLY